MVAKSLRDISKGKAHTNHHCCGMSLKEHGLGYADLDGLMQKPQPLEFILGLCFCREIHINFINSIVSTFCFFLILLIPRPVFF